MCYFLASDTVSKYALAQGNLQGMNWNARVANYFVRKHLTIIAWSCQAPVENCQKALLETERAMENQRGAQ